MGYTGAAGLLQAAQDLRRRPHQRRDLHPGRLQLLLCALTMHHKHHIISSVSERHASRCLLEASCNFSRCAWQEWDACCIGNLHHFDVLVLLQVSGIIIGMLLMGYIADQIGRKWGSVLTSTFMFIGGILLTCSTGPTIQGWAIMFAVAQFIFGYGVGGETLPRTPLLCRRPRCGCIS